MFRSRLRTEDVPPNLWRLTDPLKWHDLEFGTLEVPAGTITDLGSTPQQFRRFKAFDPSRTARRPAVGHDYLYQRAKWPDGRPCSREEADRFLYVAMLSEGHSKPVAWAWWFGVRAGGWKPWREYRKADADSLVAR